MLHIYEKKKSEKDKWYNRPTVFGLFFLVQINDYLLCQTYIILQSTMLGRTLPATDMWEIENQTITMNIYTNDLGQNCWTDNIRNYKEHPLFLRICLIWCWQNQTKKRNRLTNFSRTLLASDDCTINLGYFFRTVPPHFQW